MLWSDFFYFVAEAQNATGFSVLSNEVAADVHYCCFNCAHQRQANPNNEDEAINDIPLADILYMNDGKYQVNFNTTGNENKIITVTNVLGQTALTQQVSIGENQSIINVNDFTNGIYIINVFSNNKNVVQQKIVIAK